MSINLTQRVDIRENEYVHGVSKLGNEIFVLCYVSFVPCVIRVFEDRNPFRFQRNIKLEKINGAFDVGASEKQNCLYVSDYLENCVWKITREIGDQHKILKWLKTDYKPMTLSVNSDGQLLMVNRKSSSLVIYGSEAEFIRSIQLPRDIKNPRHGVETSIGTFIVLYWWKLKQDKGETWSRGIINWGICEVARDGLIALRHFIPSRESNKLCAAVYLSLDSDDNVFVADLWNDRVVILDSDLKWNRTMCSTENEDEETTLPHPWRLCYDKENKQLIMGTIGCCVNIYPISGS